MIKEIGPPKINYNQAYVTEKKCNSVEEEPPKQINTQTVIYWSDDIKSLVGFKNSKTKALKFVDNKCIEETDFGYICKPIEGYNKTTHKLTASDNGLICSCQGFQTKLRQEGKGHGYCCHVFAVLFYKKINKWNLKGG